MCNALHSNIEEEACDICILIWDLVSISCLGFRICKILFGVVLRSRHISLLVKQDMSSWLETCKPVASSRLQLLLAGGTWSIVGLGLIGVGTYWVVSTSDYVIGLLAISLCLGFGKSFLILDRVADRIIKRIEQRGEGRCVASFYSLRVWAIVICMMAMGRILRGVGISYYFLGLIYAAVGAGLLMSSRSIWLAWKHHPQAH